MSGTNVELIAKAMKPETDPRVPAERLRKRSVDEGETEGNSLYRDSANAIEAAGAERDALLLAVQAVFTMQCPPIREHFGDKEFGRGAFTAHRWWSTVLGGVLERAAK